MSRNVSYPVRLGFRRTSIVIIPSVLRLVQFVHSRISNSASQQLSLRFLPSIVQIILWGSHKLLKFFKILTLVNQDNDKTALQAVSHGSSVHDIVYMLFNGL
uniref:Uncharacterized protein n=1 Tax=Helianthus annuus TaxID=4232 RepID=A0A251V1T9_HELAN